VMPKAAMGPARHSVGMSLTYRQAERRSSCWERLLVRPVGTVVVWPLARNDTRMAISENSFHPS